MGRYLEGLKCPAQAVVSVPVEDDASCLPEGPPSMSFARASGRRTLKSGHPRCRGRESSQEARFAEVGRINPCSSLQFLWFPYDVPASEELLSRACRPLTN